MLYPNDIFPDFESILNATPGNYLVLLPDAPQFTIIAANDAYCHATHMGREVILDKGLFDILPKNMDATGRNLLQASLQYVLEHKKEHQVSEQCYKVINPQTGHLEVMWWRITHKPVLNKAGGVQYILHIVEDEPESIRQEKLAGTVRDNGEYKINEIYSLFMQAPVAVAIFRGKDMVIELANDRVLEYWGRTREAVLNRPLFEALPEVAGQGLEALLEGVLLTGKRYTSKEHLVYLMRHGKMETTYVDFVYEPLHESDGSVSGLIVIATDITEQVVARKREEERAMELLKINEELKRTNENLEEFTYASSHDLKEPIRKIRTFSSRLKQKLHNRLTQEETFWFTRMEKAAERMFYLVEDLLAYSYVNRQQGELEFVDLNEKLQMVIGDLELAIEEKKAIIHVGKLPALKGRRRQIQQVFQNLISNAIKYAKPGVPPEITITATEVKGQEIADFFENLNPQQSFYQIEVRDNGIGFDPIYATHIFQVFRRLNFKPEYDGTGIGLAIVKKVMDNHQGFVRAESEPGKGASFKLYFPIP